MSKFDLSKFLVENKLTQLGRLTERPMDSQESFLDSLHNNVKSQLATPEEQARLENYLDTEGYEIWDEFGGLPDGLEQATNVVLSKVTMQEASLSEEELAQQALAEKEDIVEPAVAEVEEDFSKYGSVEELMKEIERSTNEAALKHKMDRVKKAYESIESKAASLEEGEHAQYLAPGKIKEMRRSSKELRKMHERLLKEYEKRFPVKKKSELNEVAEDSQPITKNLQELTWEDVVSVFPNIGKERGGSIKFTTTVSFPLAERAALLEVRSQKQFEDWKSKVMSEFGNVEVTLDDSQKWHSKVLINSDEFNSKHNA